MFMYVRTVEVKACIPVTCDRTTAFASHRFDLAVIKIQKKTD